MSSPQYSTPYSQLSYPSYTPLSVVPVKPNGGAGQRGSGHAGSAADLRLLRAAVHSDVARQHLGGPSSEAPQLLKNSVWPAPDTAKTVRRSTGALAFSSPSTRTNAPLYAPPPHTTAAENSTAGYSDVSYVQRGRSAAGTHLFPRPSPSHAVVAGTEVDVQSDVVSVTEAVPYLCAFQDECQSLLAMLRAPSAPSRGASAAALAAMQPPPTPPVLPLPPSPVVSVSTAAREMKREEPSAAAVELRRVPSPPPAPLLPAAGATTATSHLSSLSPVAAAASSGQPPADAAAASPPTSTTYAQLLHEMDELASLLQREGSAETSPTPSPQQPPQQQGRVSPSMHSRSSASTTAPSTQTEHLRETPEKQTRGRRESRTPSTPRLAPAPGELIGHSSSPFWAAQLLRWVVFLLEKKAGVLRRVQAFENTRAPQRRGAAADAPADTTTADSSALRISTGLLRLLHSLDVTASHVATWTVQQQRQVCTRVANLLAEVTAAEEGVVADLLNDAAAGATMEREVVMVQQPPSPSPPASAILPPDYRKDMLETLALLERASSENAALKAEAVRTQGELRTLRDAAKGERDAKREVAAHFDRVAAQNSDLATKVRTLEARLKEAETTERPTAQEGVLREQLERQTQHLRDLRREVDEGKEESDSLRRTVLQLRDALVRHRAVIDLLTRHRRAPNEGGVFVSGSRQTSAGGESPPMQLIEDILSGVREAPSSHSSAWWSHTQEEEEGDDGDESLRDRSDEASSDAFVV